MQPTSNDIPSQSSRTENLFESSRTHDMQPTSNDIDDGSKSNSSNAQPTSNDIPSEDSRTENLGENSQTREAQPASNDIDIRNRRLPRRLAEDYVMG